MTPALFGMLIMSCFASSTVLLFFLSFGTVSNMYTDSLVKVACIFFFSVFDLQLDHHVTISYAERTQQIQNSVLLKICSGKDITLNE